MLYLYAILETPPPEKALPAGIGGCVPGFVEAEGLACAIGQTAEGDMARDPDLVLKHQEVVAALMDRETVLPLRFGTLVENAAACRHLLTHRSDALRAGLDRVRDCVEFAVRVRGLPDGTWPMAGALGPGPGAAYLRALALREARWPPSSGRFPHDSLAAHARERLLWARAASQEDLRASFLVRRPCISAFLAGLSDLQRLRPDLGISCTGPWPPYSFSDAAPSGGIS